MLNLNHSELTINFANPIYASYNPQGLGSGRIQMISDPSRFLGDLPDVGMDKFMVVVGASQAFGTRGLGTCFGICARGYTTEHILVLALAHTSGIEAVNEVFHSIKEEMCSQGCLEETIETFVVGGESPSTENPEGCIQDELELFSLIEEHKIKEMLLNSVNAEDNEECLSVVMTAEHIFVSKREIFDSLEGMDNAGINLFEGAGSSDDDSDVSIDF